MTYIDDYITGLENTLKAVSRSEIQAMADFYLKPCLMTVKSLLLVMEEALQLLPI